MLKLVCIEITKNIYWNGLNDRTSDLFEGIWPITKEGVSYNSYIIVDENVTLIDLVKGIKTDDFLSQIEEVVDPKTVKYVIINHMEPDHTGMIKTMLKVAPDVVFVGSEKTKQMLEDFYKLTTPNFMVVKTGDTLDLGNHTLEFYDIPWVHWPETICTYEQSSKILFSCDAFGGFGALGGSIFDEEYEDLEFYKEEALRYYANIVAKFSRFVLKAIESLKDLDIQVIAPSHGLIWKNPMEIIDLYKKWAKYSSEPAEIGVTLLYASMYGNTEKVMGSVAQGLTEEGIPVEIFDVTRTHVSYILPSLWKYRGVVIGAPTYEAKLFPPMAYVLDMAASKRVLHKEMIRFGSYGWTGGAQRDIESRLGKLKWNLVETFEFKGGPTLEDFKTGKDLGRRFAKHLKSKE